MSEISLNSRNLRCSYNEFQKTGTRVNNNFTKPDFTAKTIKEDTIILSKDKYAADDGKISLKDKLKNFAKGLVKPVTTMFSSPKNFIIGTGAIALGGVLIAATGGAIAPVMVAAGIIGGGIQFGKSAYLAATAKTDDEARNAWQGMGTGTFTVASSVAGAKGALKSAGINTEGMNCIQASAKCITSSPAQVGKSLSNITSSNAFNQLKILSKNQEKSKIKTEGETAPKQTSTNDIHTEPAKTTPEAKPVEENLTVKSEVKAEQPKTPEVQHKSSTTPEVNSVEENTISSVKNKPTQITQKDGSKVNIEYNKNGTIKKSTIVGEEGTTVKTYDTEGKIIKSESFADTECRQKIGTADFEHNSNGKISKISTYEGDGQFIAEQKINYDSNNLYESRTIRTDNGVIQYNKNGTSTFTEIKPVTEPIQATAAKPANNPTPGLKREVSMHHDMYGDNISIRGAIKKGDIETGEIADLIRRTDAEFEQLSPLTEDITVYKGRYEDPVFKHRNQDFNMIENAQIGDTIVPDTAYSYTAKNKSFAEKFADPMELNGKTYKTMMYEIRIPKGAKISINAEHNGEALMPRGAEYKIISKETTGSRTDVVLEYILPKK